MSNALKLHRKRRGLTLQALADLMGTSAQQIDRLEKGDRKFTREWAVKAGDALGVNPEDLLFPKAGSRDDVRGPTIQSVWTLMIVGEVAAGVWREANADGFEPIPYDVPADPRFPKEAQCLYRVVGTSINRKAPSGSLVRCVSVYAVADRLNGREPRDDDWVIARRTRNGFSEMTVKQLRSVDGEAMLFPDSTDPAHQEPIRIGEHDGDEVEIVAFVLDFINPATRF